MRKSAKPINEPLKKAELFSTGKYGSGDSNNPQEIDVIKRYMLTDLDTESYYIIEGVLTEKNTQTGDNAANAAGGGGGYYRLPHAIGAAKVFLSFVVVIIKSGFSSKINFTFSIFCFFNLTCFIFTNFEKFTNCCLY